MDGKKDIDRIGKGGFPKLIAFFLGASLGIVISNQLITKYGDAIPFFRGLDENAKFFISIGIYIVSSLFLGFVFLFSTPSVLKWIFKVGSRMESSLSGYTSKEITSGTIGLILGLIVAFLISDLIKLIPSWPLATVLSVLTYILFSFIGTRLGIKYIGEIIIINKRETRTASISGENYKILDSSVIIDGRILDLVRTGFLEGTFIIPIFILNQLKNIAENPDILKRNRGRRGLDVINSLKNEENVKTIVCETDFPDINDIDTKILKLAEQFRAKVITNDYNLNKLATVMKVTVLNINELANAMKPIALPGEKMTINIVKPGKEYGQGIGYLDDGTMIVVENGADYIGRTMEVTVTTTLQTNAGRMIFTRIIQE